jgi:hypothetical protein
MYARYNEKGRKGKGRNCCEAKKREKRKVERMNK